MKTYGLAADEIELRLDGLPSASGSQKASRQSQQCALNQITIVNVLEKPYYYSISRFRRVQRYQ